MNIKRGTTPVFVFNIKDLNVDEVQEVIFTFISESDEILDPITIEEPETNEFVIGLTQQQSLKLKGATEIEAQINFKDKHQEKTKLDFYYVDDTLGTKIVQGNKPNTDNPEAIELILERIQGDVALVITPEASDELLEAVTGLFNATKEVADSVRQDADAGEFDGQDGQDGYSPQVTVKTETPSTYVLHIKDADHEFDTPNLQGQGGEGSIEVGDGLKRVGNVVSVDRFDSENNALVFSGGKLNVSMSAMASNSAFRMRLADTNYINPLATRSYVDNLISTSLKRLVVQTLPQNPNTYTIYMVLRQAPTTNNIYDEYMYINNAWELIGSTEVDLSNYYTKTESDTKYQGKLTVGNGIDITSDTISVKVIGELGFTANGQLNINGTALGQGYSLRYALTDSTYGYPLQPKLTAGTNITIDSNNVISASGGGLSYTFTDGLTESSGTVGIDLASGSKLLIDANDKLDVDLSNYVSNTDYATPTVGGVVVGSAFTKFSVNSSGKPSATTTTYSDYQSGVDGMFIGKGTLENVITGKQLVNQTDLSSKQDTIDSTHKLDADNVDDSTSTNKFVSATDKQTWNAKADTTDIPTNVSELTNDSGYQTSSDVALAISGKEDKTDITTDTTSTTVSLTLADNHEYRYTQELTSLTLTMPSGNFISSIVFASGSTPTSMTYDSNIKWSGDDVTNGQFVPSEKTYNIVLWYDGINVNGVVRGVS